MTEDGTRWSHTSGEAEELNKLTTNFDIVKGSGDSIQKDRAERKRKKEAREREQRETEEEAKEKEAKKNIQGK